jgi:hypothetical protein
MGQANVIPADYIDLVKRLRVHLNDLDNCHLILDRIHQLHDPAVTNDVRKVSVDVRSTASKLANVLRQVESSSLYRDTIRKYSVSVPLDD